MALEIKLLSLIDIDIESSFLVLGRNMGVRTRIPTFGFLILGGDEPILVDTGASHADIMQRLGMTGYVTSEMELENQLARFDLTPKDVRWVLHTHLHIDHAGQDNRFPPSTTVVINRRGLPVAIIAPKQGANAREWEHAINHIVALMRLGLPIGGRRFTRDEMHER